MAEGVGRGRPVPRRRRPGRPPAAVLRARHVPVPLGRPAHGSRRGVQRWRRARTVPLDAGRQRPAPDRMGRVRAARRERGDQARHAAGRVDRGEHRPAGDQLRPVRDVVRLGAARPDLRPGVLPVDAMAVPAAVRPGPGLPREVARELVPEGRHGPGERAGDRRELRAVRHPRGAARADAVVLPDHRLRPAAARRRRRAGRLARARRDDAAELDRPLRRAPRSRSRSTRPARRSRSSRRARTPCGAPRSSCSRSSTRPCAGSPSWRGPGTRCARWSSRQSARRWWSGRPPTRRRACSSASTP